MTRESAKQTAMATLALLFLLRLMRGLQINLEYHASNATSESSTLRCANEW